MQSLDRQPSLRSLTLSLALWPRSIKAAEEVACKLCKMQNIIYSLYALSVSTSLPMRTLRQNLCRMSSYQNNLRSHLGPSEAAKTRYSTSSLWAYRLALPYPFSTRLEISETDVHIVFNGSIINRRLHQASCHERYVGLIAIDAAVITVNQSSDISVPVTTSRQPSYPRTYTSC